MNSGRSREYKGFYPVKLLYTANIQIILLTTMVSNLYFYSFNLHHQFKNNWFVQRLGGWQETPLGTVEPISGFAYFVSPPKSLLYELHWVFYSVLVIAFCVVFSRGWIYISGQAPRDVCRQISEQDMTLGDRLIGDALRKYL